ncbi:multiple sugar transport system substrate-binding protein [Streptomyces griseochromogenes]|uniref:Multiple sugar transport system substrate-binding protein n=1 Tax=Streptomyces griseochromogenes TaxID=68214 RepID=A0A1B1AWR2_9ACTN|nr:ABC transporter substrate-binding protein [Streptomyces griseochromogenes]ANP51026.1 sugar ABC transporter substrate-binding protein [Streptomyces griseochromogenes]MBP2052042.1 multiple sugar transport system substrate-binding protein [Streptomyces griseochromogenes]
MTAARRTGGPSRRHFVLALPSALLASGCAAPHQGSGRPGDPIVLTLLSHYASGELKSALQGPVDEWNATHDRVKVRTKAVEFTDLLTTFMVRQAAGQGADILHPYCLWNGQLVRAGVLRPAPSECAEEIRRGYGEAAVGAASVAGKVYGYPTEVQTYALYYNKRLLREAGVDGPPRTWRELEEAAHRTAERDPYGNTLVQGFGLSTYDDSTTVGQTLALLNAAGGSFVSADGRSTAIDSRAGRAVFELEHRLVAEGASAPGVNVYKAFPSGQVAMVISAGWWTGSLKAVMGKDYRDVGVAPVPVPETHDRRATLSTGFMLGVNTTSEHPGEAWEFLRWLNTERVRVKGATATRMSSLQVSVGSLTGRADDMRTLLRQGGDPNLRPFLDALAYAVPEPNVPGAQQAKSLLRKNIEALWTGQQSVDQALRTTRRQVDQEVSRTW